MSNNNHTKDKNGTTRSTMAKNNNGHRWHTKNNDGTTTKTTMAHQEQRWHNDKDNDGTTTTTRSRSTRAHIQCCCHDVAKRRSPETLAHQEPTLAHQEQRWHTKNNDGTPRTMLQQRCGAVRHLWAYSPLFGIRRCSAVAAVIHSPINSR